MIFRNADAWEVARANTTAAQLRKTDASEDAKQQRREHNRTLAEKLVNGWSAYEYQTKFDSELARAVDGLHDGVFDINAERYRKTVAERHLGGTDADAATAAGRQDRRVKEARFVSNQLGKGKS